MDLKKFDTTLKSALENMEVPYDSSAWAAFEDRLDGLPAPDALDTVLRPSLERIESTYDEGSWFMLANRMDTLARVKRLRMTKLAEAAIFLLLLLNLKGFFGVVESVTNPVPKQNKAPEPIAKSSRVKYKKHATKADLDSATSTELNPQNLADQVVMFVQDLTSNLSPILEIDPTNPELTSTQMLENQGSLLDGKNFYAQTGMVKFPVGNPLPGKPIEEVLFASLPISIPGIKLPKPHKSSGLYAASFGSFEQNYLVQKNHTDKKSGFGGGLAIGYRKGKWGVESGLTYTQKSYKPKRENVEYQNDPFNGISYYYIDQVDADVVSVPVKCTRRIAKLKNTSAYAVAGVTAHFATNKRYGYETVHYPPPIPMPNPDPNPSNIASLPNAKGVLESGSLNYNAYSTADLGLRVEHPLGKRYVAFVEPVYRRSLGGGLGPTASKLSTFSLQAGVMASL